MVKPIIDLRGVSLTLTSRAGPVEILRRVDVEIAPGESVAVVGPSGSGKTSLLMVIAGLERATSGEVRVASHDFMGLSEDQLAVIRGSNIGIVFQSFHLVTTMTALENVALPLEFAGKADAFDTARAVLAEVGLAHRADHFPAQLSGGEQQRVAIARAVVNRPALLLADEPTANLDAESATRILEIFVAFNQVGVAVLIASHDASLVARFGKQVLRLENGRIGGPA